MNKELWTIMVSAFIWWVFVPEILHKELKTDRPLLYLMLFPFFIAFTLAALFIVRDL